MRSAVLRAARLLCLLCLLCLVALPPLGALAYESPLRQVFGAQDHDPAITTPDALLGFPLGSRAASAEEINAAIALWAQQSDRVQSIVYGHTHQGRPLRVAFVSSPANLARLDAIRAELAELADPRGTGEARAREIIARAPAVAYIAHSIHGNETSGGDAALALVYHLAAARSAEVEALLADTVVIIDPLLNPDGRARAVSDLRGFRSHVPSYDDQDLSRGTSWPFGRGNHYVFDMNRDWIYGTQPETVGRLALLRDWHPLLFVDAHEMGGQDTFLFSPPRAPVNPHFAPAFRDYLERFSVDQAEAFDARGWVYYSGEWNEGWYPGYTDAWGGLRGAVNILYEQARVADHGVRQANHLVLRYDEGVARQLGSAWANLRSLQANHRGLLQAFWDDRRSVTGARGDYADRVFVVRGDAHPDRARALVELLELQGIEAFRTTGEWRIGRATDLMGNEGPARVPAGAIVIPNRQPMARVVANLFEFDPRIDEASLVREREALLRDGRGTIYDVTAWNLPMMFGLEAWTTRGALPGGVEPARAAPPAAVNAPVSGVGYLIPGHDDAALRAAAALLQAGLRPRVAMKPVSLDGVEHPRGSLVLSVYDHRDRSPQDLHAQVRSALDGHVVSLVALRSGRGPGDAPDLGGGEFRLLDAPRLAILGKGATNSQNFGFLWYYAEQHLGLTPTLLDEAAVGRIDLRRYNVILLPERFGALPGNVREALKAWTDAGGTLVAVGSGAAALATADSPFRARTLEASLENLGPYRQALAREWMSGQAAGAVGDQLWNRTATAGTPAAWPADLNGREDAKDLAARDAWQRLFMPRGAFVAARCDGHGWLSLGCEGSLPVLVGTASPLMAGEGVEAPYRLGVFREAGSRGKNEWTRFGWAGVPPRQDLQLRMGGLLWPEAQERLANTAWVTRESSGRGQLILFANTPAFRGATRGMHRVLGNALVLGPGVGASAPIPVAP